MNHDPVSGWVGPEVDQAVRAIVAIRVLVTNGLDIGSQQWFAMSPTSHGRANVRNGSGAAKGIGPKSGRSEAQKARLNVVFSVLRK